MDDDYLLRCWLSMTCVTMERKNTRCVAGKVQTCAGFSMEPGVLGTNSREVLWGKRSF